MTEPTSEDGLRMPQGYWERRIAAVWQDALGVELIGRDNDFFALGGDSMKGLRCMLQIHPDLEWADIFRNPTVRTLADRIRALVKVSQLSLPRGQMERCGRVTEHEI